MKDSQILLLEEILAEISKIVDVLKESFASEEILNTLSLLLKEIKEGGIPKTDYMNLKECSKYLGIPDGVLKRLCREKIIPHKKEGSKTLFDKVEIDKWREK